MKQVPALLLLAALVLLGLRGRLSTPVGPTPTVPLLQPGTAEAEQDAWRLRLVQLALVTQHSAARDRFLDAPQGRFVPWPPLYPAALASVARRTTFLGQDAVALGALEDAVLLELLGRLGPLLATLATIAAFLAARATHGAEAAPMAGLCAAALWALLPDHAFAEHAGRVDPHALTALLSFVLVGSTALALRAREEVDATLGGLVAGVSGGLALSTGLDAAVPLLACLCIYGVAAVQARPGARRALLLFAVAAAVTASLGIGRETSWSALVPWRRGWGGVSEGEALRHWAVAGLGPAALVALVAGWRRRQRLATLVLLLAGLAWAALVGPQAAGVHVVVVLAAAVACADLAERLPASRRPLAPLGLVLLVAPAFGFRGEDPLRPAAEVLEQRVAWRSALEWMRTGLPSGGPWNAPTAQPDGWVLTAPTFGATVAVGARRPVLSAAPPGLRPDADRAREAALLLAGPADTDQLEVLRVLGVRALVVAPGMVSDPWMAQVLAEAGQPTLFELLLQGGPPPAGLELVWPAGQAAGGVSVWRLSASAAERKPASVRPR